MKKKISIAGIILGLFLTVIGLKFAFNGEAHYEPIAPADYSFGADFYTEQYAATRDTALNVARVGSCMNNNLHQMMQLSSFTVAIMGLIVSCYFGLKLSECTEKGKAEIANPTSVVSIPLPKAEKPTPAVTEETENPEV